MKYWTVFCFLITLFFTGVIASYLWCDFATLSRQMPKIDQFATLLFTSMCLGTLVMYHKYITNEYGF